MGSWSFRRSKSIGPFRIQLGPRRGTISERLGPLTISSSGRNSIRLFHGLRYRFGRRRR